MSRIAQQAWWSIAPAPSEPPEYPDDDWLDEIEEEIWNTPAMLLDAVTDADPDADDWRGGADARGEGARRTTREGGTMKQTAIRNAGVSWEPEPQPPQEIHLPTVVHGMPFERVPGDGRLRVRRDPAVHQVARPLPALHPHEG
jgi:hypothetical protein